MLLGNKITAGFAQSFVYRKQSGSLFLLAGHHLVARVGEPLRLCFMDAVRKPEKFRLNALKNANSLQTVQYFLLR